MTDQTLSHPSPKTAAEYRAAIERLLVAMDRADQKMEEDRKDILRLKAEADTLKAETRAILSTLGMTL